MQWQRCGIGPVRSEHGSHVADVSSKYPVCKFAANIVGKCPDVLFKISSHIEPTYSLTYWNADMNYEGFT